MELMCADTDQVCVHFSGPERYHPDGLDRISMEQDAFLPADRADLRHGFQRTDLIVGRHDADKDRLRTDGFPDGFRRNRSVFVHRQEGDLKPLFFQPPAGIQHCRMFNAAGDQMVSLSPEDKSGSLDRQIIAFASSGCKADLAAFGAQCLRNFPPRLFQCPPCVPSLTVDPGRIPVPVYKKRQHRVQHFRKHRCGGCVIKIDPIHSVYHPLYCLRTFSGTV